MKTPKTLLILLAASAALGAMTPGHARADVSVSFFYDSLDPYGEWVQTPDYGYCWHPSNVDENWAPYTDGYWAYTDDGWTWVSYEDYGGVVYHYGRWAHLPDEGWVWVPGNTWAPAWVSWRRNDDYIGWAPLPPEAHWRSGVGFSTWVDARFDIGPGCYSFVGARDFGAPALGAVIVNRQQNITIINRTTNITNITVNNSNVYVGGPRFEQVERVSTRQIPTLKLDRRQDASLVRQNGGKFLSRQQGNSLVVLAPRITPTGPGSHLAPGKVARTLTSVKPDHGWNGVKDPQEREKLNAHYKEQAGATETAAKPVNQEDVKLVDTKIKARGNKGPKGNAEGGAAGTDLAPNGTPNGVAGGAAGANGATTGAATANGTPRGKGGKNKNADLLNTPATEQPAATDQTGAAAATAGVTPKGSKKGKKGHTATENSFLNTTGGGATAGDTTPVPKTPKGKKMKTPSAIDSAVPVDAGNTPKHPKQNDSTLQPFDTSSGGGSTGNDMNPVRTPKAKRTPKADVQQAPRSFDSGGGGSSNGDNFAPVRESKPKRTPKQDVQQQQPIQRSFDNGGAGGGNGGGGNSFNPPREPKAKREPRQDVQQQAPRDVPVQRNIERQPAPVAHPAAQPQAPKERKGGKDKKDDKKGDQTPG